jgi:hypothetical protein
VPLYIIVGSSAPSGTQRLATTVGGARHNGIVTNIELVTARDLEPWCTNLGSQSSLPGIQQLILATVSVAGITMAAGKGVLLHGWDGLVKSSGLRCREA